MLVLGHLDAHRSCGNGPTSNRVRILYYFRGYQVCKKTYTFFMQLVLSDSRILWLTLSRMGYVHGNTKRLPANTTPLKTQKPLLVLLRTLQPYMGFLYQDDCLVSTVIRKPFYCLHTCQSGMSTGSTSRLQNKKDKHQSVEESLRAYGLNFYLILQA